ncbi:malate dehydrogenase (quinone) [Brytella acorum]|uniref:Probable malate:quinone oxidoreductase n=1 Tax=Brytella acorum TaxID=2959299 RepID=A0AA35UN50_9PROT|nr:malate dehydrogenase (quinone) [Brytella acorum]MDF3623394.1 malate dehydrogenase (quinone) [Brytella acorum]CAI9120501.1 malate dehydrogenase (quinone) [Brytella acorum]
MSSTAQDRPDVVLIGAGVMSATFAALLRSLDPSLSIVAFETLDACGLESSQAWNNAGTGHAGNCELNYTTQKPDGTVDISKALDVNAQFDLSRNLWTYLVRQGWIEDPASFIRLCPHMSLVWGAKDVAFLKARHAAMSSHPAFAGMEYSEDPATIARWAPLTMQGRNPDQQVAATHYAGGTDVDFGALTRALFGHMETTGQVTTFYNHKVTGIHREADQRWRIAARGQNGTAPVSVSARFVFIGAGGAALEMLQAANIPEAQAYAGFPVSGQWLRCDDPAVVSQHRAKVYGKAAVGSPPMSVPHLDTRIIGGNSHLLFGPYAGFSTKFLKTGSWTDFYRSLTLKNLMPTLQVAEDNFSLVKYLVQQVTQSSGKRFSSLLDFYPKAHQDGWKLSVAGQRVQIIKPNEQHRGTLKFGTELVKSADKSLVALLGASPGASVAAAVALQVIETCFADRMSDPAWQARLHEIFPIYGVDLKSDAEALIANRKETGAVLKI